MRTTIVNNFKCVNQKLTNQLNINDSNYSLNPQLTPQIKILKFDQRE
jgi:hypothetical protein